MDVQYKAGRWRLFVAIISILAAAVGLLGMRLLGIRTYTVLSGSMEPAIPTGTLLLVGPVNPRKLEENDIITFRLGDSLTATHRIVSVHKTADGLQFQTKGDANSAADGKWVHENEVIGSPFLFIPGAGYFIWYIQNDSHLLFFAVTGGTALLYLLIPCRLLHNQSNRRKGKFLRQ